MNRVEIIRNYVDNLIVKMEDVSERREAYLHLYGVSQFCAMLAIKRGEDVELSMISGMLHDISAYITGDRDNHARKSSVTAREILKSIKLFADNEVDLICGAIYYHSEKSTIHSDFNEILKDADALQHYMYNPFLNFFIHEKDRVDNLIIELHLA